MTKTARARYTLEFKQEAVRLVEGGQSLAAAARTLGLVEQTLFNWVKAKREGKLSGADSKAVSAEQMEISRLRAELGKRPLKTPLDARSTEVPGWTGSLVCPVRYMGDFSNRSFRKIHGKIPR
ncbi:hypothetical protein GmRootV35_12490 [Variovorax sp. V35]